MTWWNNRRIIWFLGVTVTCMSAMDSAIASAQQARKPFTVADEIGLNLFGDANGGRPEVHFSPNGNYFAVWTERGLLNLNRVEDSLRFYSTQGVEAYLAHSEQLQPPAPIWIMNRSTNREGRIINDWCWLSDSSGVAFLERGEGGNQRLVRGDLRNKILEPLTAANERVDKFVIRDGQHYVYIVADLIEAEKSQPERRKPEIVGTGHKLIELLLPDDPVTVQYIAPRRRSLWAVVGGKRFEVKHDGAPLFLDEWASQVMALSPDGQSVLTELKVPEVPVSWETLYPPDFASSHRIHAGRNSAHQYVRINLQTGSLEPLTDAPASHDAGWWAGGNGSWSSDGQSILLPGTFLGSKDNAPSRPCVAVVDLGSSNTRTCVEILKGHTETGVEEGYHSIVDAWFAGGDKQRVIVLFMKYPDWSYGATEYRHTVDGTWQVARQIKGMPEVGRGLEVAVKQGFNDPPLLTATNKKGSRIIWDPNPQLKDIELGQASVYTWKDKEGRDWRGGLYKPSNYEVGRRYPLVIQTHGFMESEFRPSGLFPTAFAARALAAVGMVVLQVAEHCPGVTPSEGPCAVSGYEAAVNQLASEEVVDSERIGIIGFSRSGFYVMETLTTGSIHIKAASITDSVMFDYFQYMMWPERSATEADPMIGAAPFGDGLREWLKRSPGFNLDKVNAPLLVVGEGPWSLLYMWLPYAGLRYLQKPVDLIMLSTREHVLTNPAIRMASQGGSVDWFRFWLQDYEDPDPGKAEQYARWRELRKMQGESRLIPAAASQ